MRKTKGVIIGKDKKPIYVQLGSTICEMHAVYDVEKDFKGFSKFLEENTVMIAKDGGAQ